MEEIVTLTDQQLVEFAPYGLLVRQIGARDDEPYGGEGVRMKVNPGRGTAQQFEALPEFVDGYTVGFPRRVVYGGDHLLLRRDGNDFIATPLSERDAWRTDPYYLED